MSTVSVIIPVYNTEEYLEQSIGSVINQSYKNLEIIIVDDCSDDDSVKIIKKFAKEDERIKLIELEERKGVGAARNIGLKKATGEYIYFFDSDDYIPQDTIQYLVEHIDDHVMIRGKIKSTELSSGFCIIYKGQFVPKIFTENKYNLIKNNSVCNFLIRRDYIQEKRLSFSEENKIFSDLYFMIPALKHTHTVPYLNEAVYFKRRRSDPVYNLALSQINELEKITEFLKSYIELKEFYKSKDVNEFLDKKFLNFYREEIVKFYTEEKNIEDIFKKLYEAAQKIDKEYLRQYDFVLKREINILLKGNIKRYKRLVNRFGFLRDLKKALKSKNNFYLLLYKRFFTKLPIDDKLVFFESFQGRSYSDNPKYIYEYMLDNKNDYKFVWSFKNKERIKGNPIVVKRLGLSYYYYLGRAKYWVTNARMPNNIFKRKEAVYLQTWHGTPLKKLASDMDNVFMPGTNIVTYKKNFYRETKQWDYLISANEYSTKIFRRAFWFNKQMLEFGYPRNDILYTKNNEKDVNQIKEKLNIPKEKKIILYAPTWRDDEYYEKGSYKFSLKIDLEEFREKLKDEYFLILRMHYLISSNLDLSRYNDFVLDLSNYNDISELYLISDILITDYSSVFFDYANLKRPILFYMYDIEKYRDQLRGFYLNIGELPGPILKTTGDLLDSISNIDLVMDRYAEKYEIFYKKYCNWDNGKASENVVKTVFK